MPSPIMGSRRTSMEIVHEILSLCDNGGINKTAIMYRSNLSYDQLRRYLSALCEDDLIAKNERGLFEVTFTGRKALKRMSNAIHTLRHLRTEIEAQPVPVIS